MPQITITEEQVRRLPEPDTGRVVYSDKRLKGFTLVAGRRAKSFYAQRDVRGKTQKVFLGRYGEIGVLDARNAAEEVIHGMRKGEAKYLKRDNPTLRDALALYLATTTTKAQHQEYVRRACETRLKDWLDRPLRDLTRSMIRSRHVTLAKDGKVMANDTLRAFRTVYNSALAEYERANLPVCPTIALRGRWFAETNERNHPVRDLAAWRKALDAVPNPVHRAIYMTCLTLGLRKTEACQITWDRVDLAAGTVMIRENKANRPHLLPLTPAHIAILEPMRGLHEKWVFPDRSNAGPVVDPRHDDVPGTMHGLRHTFASVAAEIGVSDDVIARLLNHSTRRITSRYITVDVEALRPSMESIADEMARRMSQKEAG